MRKSFPYKRYYISTNIRLGFITLFIAKYTLFTWKRMICNNKIKYFMYRRQNPLVQLPLRFVVSQPRCHNDKLGVRATKEVQNEVMDSVQMVTSAGRTAGALLTHFNTTTNRCTAKTVTLPTIKL